MTATIVTQEEVREISESTEVSIDDISAMTGLQKVEYLKRIMKAKWLSSEWIQEALTQSRDFTYEIDTVRGINSSFLVYVTQHGNRKNALRWQGSRGLFPYSLGQRSLCSHAPTMLDALGMILKAKLSDEYAEELRKPCYFGMSNSRMSRGDNHRRELVEWIEANSFASRLASFMGIPPVAETPIGTTPSEPVEAPVSTPFTRHWEDFFNTTSDSRMGRQGYVNSCALHSLVEFANQGWFSCGSVVHPNRDFLEKRRLGEASINTRNFIATGMVLSAYPFGSLRENGSRKMIALNRWGRARFFNNTGGIIDGSENIVHSFDVHSFDSTHNSARKDLEEHLGALNAGFLIANLSEEEREALKVRLTEGDHPHMGLVPVPHESDEDGRPLYFISAYSRGTASPRYLTLKSTWSTAGYDDMRAGNDSNLSRLSGVIANLRSRTWHSDRGNAPDWGGISTMEVPYKMTREVGKFFIAYLLLLLEGGDSFLNTRDENGVITENSAHRGRPWLECVNAVFGEPCYDVPCVGIDCNDNEVRVGALSIREPDGHLVLNTSGDYVLTTEHTVHMMKQLLKVIDGIKFPKQTHSNGGFLVRSWDAIIGERYDSDTYRGIRNDRTTMPCSPDANRIGCRHAIYYYDIDDDEFYISWDNGTGRIYRFTAVAFCRLVIEQLGIRHNCTDSNPWRNSIVERYFHGIDQDDIL